MGSNSCIGSDACYYAYATDVGSCRYVYTILCTCIHDVYGTIPDANMSICTPLVCSLTLPFSMRVFSCTGDKACDTLEFSDVGNQRYVLTHEA